MTKSFLTIFCLSLTAFFSLDVPAQDNKGGKDEVIRVDTQVVDVPVAVTNAKGMAVAGLKQSNFVVYEDGKRQEIADFSATAEPFEVALLLDTSGSTRNDLQLIQRAASDFINSLRSGDRVAIIAYNTGRDDKRTFPFTEVVSFLTGDRRVLGTAVEQVRTSNGTPYYDSLLQVVEKVFRERPAAEFRGRRAVVALTDGVDSSSGADFESAKGELMRAGVISFFIKVDTRDFFESNLLGDCETSKHFSVTQLRRYYQSIAAKGNMEKTFNFCKLGDFERLAVSKRLYEIADLEMNELAKTSGGRVFPVGDLGEARSAFKMVAEEIGTKYTIGYYPSNDKKDGTYRKIKVEVVGLPKGTTVRAREGYTAPIN